MKTQQKKGNKKRKKQLDPGSNLESGVWVDRNRGLGEIKQKF